MIRKVARITSIVLIVSLVLPLSTFANDLVVYSARKEHLITPIFQAYTAKTGVEIEFTTGKEAALVQRILSEGKRTPADILITVDAGNLWYAAEAGILKSVQSNTLEANIPSHLRDPENRWFGLSVRARTIVYHSGRVSPGTLSTYEALADPEWKGRLILRTSKKVYNQSLVAMMIQDIGLDNTKKVISGWVGNLAVPPLSSDTKVMEAIDSGVGDVGIVNTYYFGRLLKKNPRLPLKLYWPNQETTGVHVNVSGAGVTSHAKHPEAAVAFLEWVSSEEAQNLFADVNMEYPVNPQNQANSVVQAWGDFKANPRNVASAGQYQGEAIRLMDEAGYK
ncbi:MAG: extracellular solute-binding protein [Desulfobacteraceae bacterium]|nr:extracellular solute-binding protein [Desulfobacteraceae bacterium]MBC2750831.1 extracellular solute-binding protein [Desulfobacteraceae bacterium]